MEFSIDCFIVLLKFNICQLTLNVTYDTFFSLSAHNDGGQQSHRWNWQVNVKCMHNLKLNRRNKFSLRMYCNFCFANLIPCILQRTNYCGSAMDTFSDSTSPSMKSRIYCFFFQNDHICHWNVICFPSVTVGTLRLRCSLLAPKHNPEIYKNCLKKFSSATNSGKW